MFRFRNLLLIVNSLLFLFFASSGEAGEWEWTSRESGVDNDLVSVAWGNGVFVVVGEGGVILTSEDGVEWQENSALDHLMEVIWNGDRFVAVGGENDGIILTSANGIDWVDHSNVLADSLRFHFSSVAFRQGRYVVAGLRGIIYSFNLEEWFVGVGSSSVWITDIVYGVDKFVGVGMGSIITSLDGDVWYHNPGQEEHYSYSVAFGNGVFITGDGGWNSMISPDGINWSVEEYYISLIEFVNGLFFSFVGPHPEISSDGLEWTAIGDVGFNSNSVASNGELYVIVGENGGIATSPGVPTSIITPKNHNGIKKNSIKQQNNTLQFTNIFPDGNLNNRIKMYNVSGRVVEVSPVYNSGGIISIPVSHLTPGVYVLEVGSVREPVVLER